METNRPFRVHLTFFGDGSLYIVEPGHLPGHDILVRTSATEAWVISLVMRLTTASDTGESRIAFARTPTGETFALTLI